MPTNPRFSLAIACALLFTTPGCETGGGAEQNQQGTAQAQAQQKEGNSGNKKARMKKMMKKMMNKDKSAMPSDKDVRATVTQPKGQVTYWVTPGPRKLDTYFGTKENPKLTATPPENAPKPVKQLLRDVPILVGVPEQARTYKNGEAFTKMPTPFGNKGIPVEDSSLDLTYIDRQSDDKKGPPIKTADEVEADIQFTDPQGNAYTIEPKLVFQPPIPGYKTQGGVMTDDSHHGTTGTGTPLMPQVYTWGAMWSVADIKINGEVADKNKVVHCMTTETVRNKDYKLAMQDDLPLPDDQTIAGQRHHSHCIALPITITPQGPKHEPVQTAFELPNGKKQPFIHIMYENDQLGEGPQWNGPPLSK
ncbi:MAG: hypothetical protein ABEN55_07185 [Bradymonadaceae bacterium]